MNSFASDEHWNKKRATKPSIPKKHKRIDDDFFTIKQKATHSCHYIYICKKDIINFTEKPIYLKQRINI